MAYRSPITLTCPKCDFTGDITLIVGVGPHSKPGDTPYRRYDAPGPFKEGPFKDALLCPNDDTVLWRNIEGFSAEDTP